MVYLLVAQVEQEHKSLDLWLIFLQAEQQSVITPILCIASKKHRHWNCPESHWFDSKRSHELEMAECWARMFEDLSNEMHQCFTSMGKQRVKSRMYISIHLSCLTNSYHLWHAFLNGSMKETSLIIINRWYLPHAQSIRQCWLKEFDNSLTSLWVMIQSFVSEQPNVSNCT